MPHELYRVDWQWLSSVARCLYQPIVYISQSLACISVKVNILLLGYTRFMVHNYPAELTI